MGSHHDRWRKLLYGAVMFLLFFAAGADALSIRTPALAQRTDGPFQRLWGRRAVNVVRRQDLVETSGESVRMSFSDWMRLKHRQRNEERRRQRVKRSVGPDLVLTQNISGSEVPNSIVGGDGSFDEASHELYEVSPEVDAVHLAFTLISVFIVFFGLFSAFIKEKLYAGEAIIAVVMGIAFGPYGANLFDPRDWGDGYSFDDITLEFTRAVIALSVFAVGVELPRAYIWRHRRSLFLLLGPVMLVGWLVVGAFMYILIPQIDFLQALVIAAASTPTDPILAASVVGRGLYAQKHVPAHLRHVLQCESGSNDGAAFPFLYLAMFILLRGSHSIGRAIGQWIVLVILYQIILGVVIGAIIGVLARKLLKFCKRKRTIDRESMVAMYVALALLTTGLTTLAGSDDLLAAFACGTAFAWDDWFTASIEESNFSNIIDLLINCTTFIYIGATMPFSAWDAEELSLQPWRLAVLVICVLLLRRMPSVFILQAFLPDVKTPREAIFVGHFGPIGVGAIFISTLAALKLPTPSVPPQNSMDVLGLTVQPVTYCLVLCSVLVHGLSIPFFTLGNRMHNRVHSMTRTWTAASGGEPSWLSRVKRVDKAGDVIIEKPPILSPAEDCDEKEKADISPVQSGSSSTEASADPEKVADQLERGESIVVDKSTGEGRKIRIAETDPEAFRQSGFPDTSQKQAALEKMVLGGIAEEDPNHEEGADQDASVAQRALQLTPSPGSEQKRQRRATLTDMVRPNMFRLPTATKRTADEQAEHDREKLERDEWCRRERRDNPKANEERMYVSGRKIIIEKGPGDVVEVRDLNPTPEAKRRAAMDPSQRLIGITAKRFQTETEAVAKEGNGAEDGNPMADALEAAKRLVKRRFTFTGPAEGSGGAMPAPGQGPRPQRRSSLEEDVREITAADLEKHQREMQAQGKGKAKATDDKPIESPQQQQEERNEGVVDRSTEKSCHESRYDLRGERRWLEGDKLIIERNDGEDVEVHKLNPDEIKEFGARHLGEDTAQSLSLQELFREVELRFNRKELALEGKKAWTKLRHGRWSPTSSPKRSMERPRTPKSGEAPIIVGAAAFGRDEAQGSTASLVKEEPDEHGPSRRRRSIGDRRPSSRPRERQGGNSGDEASSSSNGGDSRGRPRQSRSRSASKASPPARRARAATGTSGQRSRSPAPPPRPPSPEHEAPPSSPEVERQRAGYDSPPDSPSGPPRPSVARQLLDREDGRPPRRTGSGLLLAPGEGVAFGTEGHYSRSSSPSRGIRFAEAQRPDRSAAASPVVSDVEGGSGKETPSKKTHRRRSRLRFGSSKKKGGGGGSDAGGPPGTSGDEEDVIG